MSLIEQYARKEGVTEPVNGSWLQAICEKLLVSYEGDAWQNIAQSQRYLLTEPLNGSWIQAIALAEGIKEPVNGSWLQAIVQ